MFMTVEFNPWRFPHGYKYWLGYLLGMTCQRDKNTTLSKSMTNRLRRLNVATYLFRGQSAKPVCHS